MLRKKRRRAVKDIAPDEIFLDSHNLPNFDTDQFEGRIERPISRFAIFMFAGTLAVIGVLLLSKTFALQVVGGSDYREQAEQNRLSNSIIFPERAVIYDRRGTELAWNESFATSSAEDRSESMFARRLYATSSGLSHILGFVSYPKKDTSGFYFQDAIVGVDGIEAAYNETLGGTPGTKIIEEDALGEMISQSTVNQPEAGKSLSLTIDARINDKLAVFMTELADKVGFAGGASVILDVRTGEILALVSTPEYDPQILADTSDNRRIEEYNTSATKPFLNRAIAGRYAPGSIMKPFVAIGALSERTVTPEKQFYSDGALELPNPYNPEEPTVFKDWKAHGWVDMRRAIAVSSNVYFFTIGGGFEDQKGLGIDKIGQYSRMFGIGQMSGIDIPGEEDGTIPSIAWKEKLFPDDPWRIGDTYNTAIGQYGFQVTPIQMARAFAAVANRGLLVTPHLVADTNAPVDRVSVDDEVFQVIHEGMRLGAIEGTGRALNFPTLHIATKTGTAELGVSKQKVNSWVTGFWPYENPHYAFATVMEQGPVTNLIGSASVMNRLFTWMIENTPEYLE